MKYIFFLIFYFFFWIYVNFLKIKYKHISMPEVRYSFSLAVSLFCWSCCIIDICADETPPYSPPSRWCLPSVAATLRVRFGSSTRKWSNCYSLTRSMSPSTRSSCCSLGLPSLASWGHLSHGSIVSEWVSSGWFERLRWCCCITHHHHHSSVSPSSLLRLSLTCFTAHASGLPTNWKKLKNENMLKWLAHIIFCSYTLKFS